MGAKLPTIGTGLHHLVDQNFHQVETVMRVGSVLPAGGAWLGEEKVVHTADAMDGIVEARGHAAAQHSRKFVLRIAARMGFALDYGDAFAR